LEQILGVLAADHDIVPLAAVGRERAE